MMIYGYCRISTPKQNIARQEDNIKALYPSAVIIKEAYTGTTLDRPSWNKLKSTALKKAASGEEVTIVFDEVSRMSRNAAEGFTTYKELYSAGVDLIFLKERHIDTAVFRSTAQAPKVGEEVADAIIDGINKALLILAEKQIKIAFETAEHEVDFLHKRTSEGVKRAIKRFEMEEATNTPHEKKKPGRQANSTVQTKKEKAALELMKHNKDFGGTLNDEQTRQLIACSRNSFYKYKKLYRESI